MTPNGSFSSKQADKLHQLRGRANILDTAWQMFQQTNYTSFTIAEVAKASGLAKGRVYLYFKTKEEVFLSIQEEQLTAWFDEVDSSLQIFENDFARELSEFSYNLCSMDLRVDRNNKK